MTSFEGKDRKGTESVRGVPFSERLEERGFKRGAAGEGPVENS